MCLYICALGNVTGLKRVADGDPGQLRMFPVTFLVAGRNDSTKNGQCDEVYGNTRTGRLRLPKCGLPGRSGWRNDTPGTGIFESCRSPALDRAVEGERFCRIVRFRLLDAAVTCSGRVPCVSCGGVVGSPRRHGTAARDRAIGCGWYRLGAHSHESDQNEHPQHALTFLHSIHLNLYLYRDLEKICQVQRIHKGS
jgi:hypothetical protein